MVKLQPTTYDLIEAGIYPAIVDSVTPEEPSDRYPDSSPRLKFIFLASDPIWVQTADENATEAKVFEWTGQTFGSKSKLRPWLEVLLPTFNPNTDELDTDDLIGRRCRIVVTIKKGDDGKERNRITDLMPAEARRRPATAAATADVPF